MSKHGHMNMNMQLLLLPVLLVLDVPYYLLKWTGDACLWVAERWPPFTEIAQDIWRQRD